MVSASTAVVQATSTPLGAGRARKSSRLTWVARKLAQPVLLPLTVSDGAEEAREAQLVMRVTVPTRAFTVRVAESPAARGPTSQVTTPPPKEAVPRLGVSRESKESSAGRGSVMVSDDPGAGPRLVAVSV